MKISQDTCGEVLFSKKALSCNPSTFLQWSPQLFYEKFLEIVDFEQKNPSWVNVQLNEFKITHKGMNAFNSVHSSQSRSSDFFGLTVFVLPPWRERSPEVQGRALKNLNKSEGQTPKKKQHFNTQLQLEEPQNQSNTSLISCLYAKISSHCSRYFFKWATKKVSGQFMEFGRSKKAQKW